jgi:hypothetical protein
VSAGRILAKSSFWATCAVFFAVAPAFAEGHPAPEVLVKACQRFTAEQVRELFELELSTESVRLSEATSYTLMIECRSGEIELELQDGHGEVQMERTIAEPARTSTEPERTVALAGAELVFALGWRPHPPEQTPPAVEVVKPQTISPPKDEPASEESGGLHRAILRGSYLLNLRSLATEPYMASSAIIAAQLQLAFPVRFGVAFGYEAGSSTAQKVTSQVVSTGAQLGYAFALSTHVDVAVELGIRALYVTAKWDQPGSVEAVSASGWRPDFTLRVGPEWVPGSWGIGMSLNGGFTASELVLPEVTPEPYIFGGPWVGITMDLLLNRHFGG